MIKVNLDFIQDPRFNPGQDTRLKLIRSDISLDAIDEVSWWDLSPISRSVPEA